MTNQNLIIHNPEQESHENKRKLDVKVLSSDEIERDVVEVTIKMPFGYLAGKWWGPKDVQPVLAFHGWQDNAGSFDRLIPLLPRNISVLAIDSPGHGLSSKIPDGLNYNYLDNLMLVMTLIRTYKWKKITILAHSMGATHSFVFASVFPEFVEMVIALDALKPLVFSPQIVPEVLQDNVEKFLIADHRNRDLSEPPLYDYNGLVEKLFTGSNEWVSRETCHYILKRSVRESTKHPERYYFGRDARLKFHVAVYLPQEVILVMAQKIVNHKIPYLFIKADQTGFFESEEYFTPVFEIMKTNPNFEQKFISGSHHCHLTNPMRVAPLITEFLLKHKNKSKL